MRTDWYKDVNPNLDRLAQILGMAGGNKPSHGYTIAEKAPEVVTAPGVYFPAEKGEVIPMESRQGGGNVAPSLPKDNDRAKLEMLHSILSTVKPSNLESRELGGSVIPRQGDLEKLKIEQSKYDILKSAISVLKPQAQQKSPSAKEKTPTTGENSIPLESRQEGGEVDPADLDLLKSILMRSTKGKLPYNERTSAYGSPGWFGSEKTVAGGKPYSPFAIPSLPGIPKPPTAQSYGIQPEATKLGVADKGISEGDLLWQKKRKEAGWANPAQDLWEHKREEGMKAGQWSMPMFSRQIGGNVDPWINAEDEARRARLRGLMNPSTLMGEVPPQPVPAPPPTEQVPAGLEGFITNINRTPTGTTYTGPEGQAIIGPERFFLGDKEVPTGTTGAVSGETLARERLSADIKKQESERELLAKGQGYGQDMGYWAAHPEEKAQYDFEEMLSRGRYSPTQRAELTKQYIESKGKLDIERLKPAEERTPLSIGGKGIYIPGLGFQEAPWREEKAQKEYQPHSFIKPDGTIGWIEPGKEVPSGWKPYEKPEKPEKLSIADATARFNGRMRGIKQRMMVDMAPDEQEFVASQPEGNLLALLLSGKIGQKLSPKLKEQYKQEALAAEKEFDELSGGVVERKGGRLPTQLKGVMSTEEELGRGTMSSRGEVPSSTYKDKEGKEMVKDPTSSTGWRYR